MFTRFCRRKIKFHKKAIKTPVQMNVYPKYLFRFKALKNHIQTRKIFRYFIDTVI